MLNHFPFFFSPFSSFPFILQLLFALTLIFWRLTKKHQVFFCNKFFSSFWQNKKRLQDWSLPYLCRTIGIYFFLLWTTSGVTSKAYDSPELTYLLPQLFKTDLRRMWVFSCFLFIYSVKKWEIDNIGISIIKVWTTARRSSRLSGATEWPSPATLSTQSQRRIPKKWPRRSAMFTRYNLNVFL